MLYMRRTISFAVFTLALITFVTPGFTSQHLSQDFIPLQTSRLITDADHKNFLINTLDQAKKTVMISSYEVSPKIFHNDNIAKSIMNAANRGVKIYIYFEHKAWCSNEDYNKYLALQKCCEKFEINCNHSKCVLKDNDTVAIGSYNWLSDFNNTSSNATIVTTGDLAYNIKEDVWQGMRFYQSLAHDNTKGINNFCSSENVFTPKLYQIASLGQVVTLRTPEAHQIFLKQTFDKARNNIYMFSPFIRLQKLQNTFTPEILSNLEIRKIKTVLITLPTPYTKNAGEQSKIFALLNDYQKNYPSFSYKTQKDFHAKTLISDNIVCEGSFNWLSAVSETDHNANNYEVSIAITGNLTLDLQKSFQSSVLGELVLPEKVIFTNKTNSPSVQKNNNSNNFDTNNNMTLSIPTDFDKHINIYSGACFNKKGFCVKLEGDYIRDESNRPLYFENEKIAKETAYNAWLDKQQSDKEKSTSINTKRHRMEDPIETPYSIKKYKTEMNIAPLIPSSFDKHLNIYSGAQFGKQGFCIKLDGDYIVDTSNRILYFENKEMAKETAYNIWNTDNYS